MGLAMHIINFINEGEHLLLMNLNVEHLNGGIEIRVCLRCLYLVNGAYSQMFVVLLCMGY